MRKVLSLVVFLSFIASVGLAADTYKIDPVHSNIGFTVKHMMVSNVSGQFDEFSGEAIYDPKDLDHSKVNVTINVGSIDTHNEKRDTHLKGPDFFDGSKFSTITFTSKKLTPTEIIGDLTVKGVTKEVSVPATISGPVKGMMGSDIIGINGSLTLNRQDYGISFNKTLDQGGLAVSNDVVVNFSFEADKQEPAKESEKK